MIRTIAVKNKIIDWIDQPDPFNQDIHPRQRRGDILYVMNILTVGPVLTVELSPAITV